MRETAMMIFRTEGENPPRFPSGSLKTGVKGSGLRPPFSGLGSGSGSGFRGRTTTDRGLGVALNSRLTHASVSNKERGFMLSLSCRWGDKTRVDGDGREQLVGDLVAVHARLFLDWMIDLTGELATVHIFPDRGSRSLQLSGHVGPSAV